MTEKSIEHSFHLFVHATNAEGHDIFQTVNSVCSKVDAEILVMSAVHKVRCLSQFMISDLTLRCNFA